jgi:hypothetical protein
MVLCTRHLRLSSQRETCGWVHCGCSKNLADHSTSPVTVLPTGVFKSYAYCIMKLVPMFMRGVIPQEAGPRATYGHVILLPLFLERIPK